jgi:branched-chain amino acid transport system permease protein
MLASSQLAGSPIHHAINLPFWLLLVIAVVVAATFGVVLGAPTLRLRGDYLAIVTLGFGEIVPRVFRNLSQFTGGVNGITAISPPALPGWLDGPWTGLPFAIDKGTGKLGFIFLDPISYYVLMVLLILIAVVLVNNLYSSRLGRAWMAVREDEVAAAAMGVNTVNIKLLAFAIGASFSGFAGCYYAAKLGLVSPENFSFQVSVTILCMVVLGGMGNIPGAIVGAIVMYLVIYVGLDRIPDWLRSLGGLFGVDASGAGDYVLKMQYLIFGLILVGIMVLRPQGLIPSRIRAQELEKGTSQDSVFDESTA